MEMTKKFSKIKVQMLVGADELFPPSELVEEQKSVYGENVCLSASYLGS